MTWQGSLPQARWQQHQHYFVLQQEQQSGVHQAVLQYK
jgi:hypothetical protein